MRCFFGIWLAKNRQELNLLFVIWCINIEKMKPGIQKLSIGLPIILTIACIFLSTGCKKDPSPAGRDYWLQIIWAGGPNDLDGYVEFKEGGTLSHHDDTSTQTGTWSNVEEIVIWSLNNPPRNTSFRGTFSKDNIAGNITDDLGRTATFQGFTKK